METFVLSEEDVERIKAWKKQFDGEYQGVCGGVFSYIFIPTTIGMIVKVTHVSGAELDLTDYDSW